MLMPNCRCSRKLKTMGDKKSLNWWRKCPTRPETASKCKCPPRALGRMLMRDSS